MSARKPAASGSASGSAASSAPGTRKASAASAGGSKLLAPQTQIKNAAEAKEIEDEAAARALARKPKAALTPAEKRAAKLRQEQLKEEAAAAKKLKEKKLAEMKAARRLSGGGGSQPDTGRKSHDGSVDGSSDPSGRQSAAGLHPDSGAGAGEQEDVEFIENPDGTFTAVRAASASETQAAQDDADEAAAEAAALAEKKEEENYDIIFDGPKSPLIMATAAKHYHEILRLIQEVPIEYRVEFVNAYDDHGCSAIFFAIGPEHQVRNSASAGETRGWRCTREGREGTATRRRVALQAKPRERQRDGRRSVAPQARRGSTGGKRRALCGHWKGWLVRPH